LELMVTVVVSVRSRAWWLTAGLLFTIGTLAGSPAQAQTAVPGGSAGLFAKPTTTLLVASTSVFDYVQTRAAIEDQRNQGKLDKFEADRAHARNIVGKPIRCISCYYIGPEGAVVCEAVAEEIADRAVSEVHYLTGMTVPENVEAVWTTMKTWTGQTWSRLPSW
jgi:hypothetical protein